MKVGDLVRVKKPPFIPGNEMGRPREGQHGIVIDMLEMEDGYFEIEVAFKDDVDWYSAYELEVLSIVQ